MDNDFIPLVEIAGFQVAKLFWNPFKSEVSKLSDIYHEVDRNWEIRLTNCRQKATSNMIAFIKDGNLPICLKATLEEDMISLHEAYHKLLMWKKTYDPYNRINIFEEGKFYAPNYFTLNGEFNDLLWTKNFVLDLDYDVIDRFNLACSYWYENESKSLFLEIWFTFHFRFPFREENIDIINLQFLGLIDHNSPLSSLIYKQFVYQYNRFDGEYQVENSFWFDAFNHSVKNGYEHAVYYIWEKMPNVEKSIIMENDSIFELMSRGIDFPQNNITWFLFLELSDDRKEDLLVWTIRNGKLEIWHTLLCAPYERDMFSKVIDLFGSLSYGMRHDIFRYIAQRIKQLQLPWDEELFKGLWEYFPGYVQQHVLKCGASFIETLAKAKSFSTLRSIINSLSNKQKNKCLLKDCFKAGISNLHIFVKEGEFEFLERYLSLFLFKINPLTLKEIPRKDARSVLRKFLKSSKFKAWCEKDIFESEVENVMHRIHNIYKILTPLRQTRK